MKTNECGSEGIASRSVRIVSGERDTVTLFFVDCECLIRCGPSGGERRNHSPRQKSKPYLQSVASQCTVRVTPVLQSNRHVTE